MQDESARQRGNENDLCRVRNIEILIYINTGYGSKWKSGNDKLEPRNDEAGVTKRSGCECKEDQY